MSDFNIDIWRKYEYTDTDEVISNLWIGDMWSAKDVAALKKRNIRSILSVMRGQVDSRDGFKHCQISVDDSETEDLLAHFPRCIQFIEEELSKGSGVLVHCHAGISRSATIVTAYLMFAQQIDSISALKLVEKARPCVQPNDGFLRQLDIFYHASFQKGNYTVPVSNDFASGEQAPFDNDSSTSRSQTHSIRCRMCRQELATTENILHQSSGGPPRPGQRSSLSPSSQSGKERPPDTTPSRSTNYPPGFALKTYSTNSTSAQSRESKIAMETALRYKEEGVNSPSASNASIEKHMNITSSLTTAVPVMTSIMQPGDLSASASTHRQLGALDTARHLRSPDCTPGAPFRIGTSCSGYFVEAMPWMRLCLSQGQLAGKITCPNKRCNAKLGNYDWAGMSCGCKEWVVPGFCIHLSKVDEVS